MQRINAIVRPAPRLRGDDGINPVSDKSLILYSKILCFKKYRVSKNFRV